jgi:hypothetical protein
MKREQAENLQSETSLVDAFNADVEELEPITAPGNTWSV